jgi:hypothetical protein
MESREKQHHWTAETTVVRLAREAGFDFHDILEDAWHEPTPFVLAFRRPLEPGQPAGDPGLPTALDAAALVRALPPVEPADAAVIFIGLDRGRAVLPVLRDHLPSSTRLFDVVLEEWAVSREELPEPPPPAGVEILRTEKGGLTVPQEVRVGLVLFADAYHRLWKPVPLLQGLKEQMLPAGLVALVERDGPEAEPRRLAGHRRRLSSQQVVEDMRQTGFQLRRTLPAPTAERYGLLFGSRAASGDPRTERPQSPKP